MLEARCLEGRYQQCLTSRYLASRVESRTLRKTLGLWRLEKAWGQREFIRGVVLVNPIGLYMCSLLEAFKVYFKIILKLTTMLVNLWPLKLKSHF